MCPVKCGHRDLSQCILPWLGQGKSFVIPGCLFQRGRSIFMGNISKLESLSLPKILIKEDSLACPAVLMATHDTWPVSCKWIPFTVSESMDRVLIKNRSDGVISRSFKYHVTWGLGNPRLTGQIRRTITPSTTCKSCPILTTASSIPSRPMRRPVDDLISGLSAAARMDRIRNEKEILLNLWHFTAL